jgi:carotenoid cleavage dioxygenase-like enzyme
VRTRAFLVEEEAGRALCLEPALYRWTFDLATGTVGEEQLDDTLAEFRPEHGMTRAHHRRFEP